MRGKKTPPEMVYKVMVSWAITHNNMETSRQLGIPEATVRKIVEDNRESEEFKKLCEEKTNDFAEKTTKIIDQLLERITKAVADGDKDIPLHHLTTAMGTLFDKRALSRGEMTQNINFATNSETFDKLASLSGYEKVEKAEEDDE